MDTWMGRLGMVALYNRFIMAIMLTATDLTPSLRLTRGARYLLHMKRTNLVLDAQLLDEATRLSGERTYSAAVTRALTDYVRRARAGKILDLQGSGLWQGDLSAMRGDSPPRRSPRTSRASRR